MLRSKLFGVALTTLILAACDNSSSDPVTPPPPPTETNLLTNSDFSGGDTGNWQFYTGEASPGVPETVTQSVGDCTADGFTGNCFTFTTSGFTRANPWDSALQAKNGSGGNLAVNFQAGKHYKIRFKAQSTADVVVHAYSALPADPWTTAVDQAFTITSTVGSFETDAFTPGALTGCQLAFRFGFSANTAGATVKFDDIQLVEY